MQDQNKERCKLETCDQIIANRRIDSDYCSDECRFTYHNSRKKGIRSNALLFIDQYRLDHKLATDFFGIFGNKTFDCILIKSKGFSFSNYGQSVLYDGLEYYVVGEYAYRVNRLKTMQIIELDDSLKVKRINTRIQELLDYGKSINNSLSSNQTIEKII